MDELDVLARDFGYTPQGKSAPMRSDAGDRRPSAVRSSAPPSSSAPMFNDVLGGPPKFTNPSNNSFKNEFDYDSIFKNNETSHDDNNKNHNDYSKNSSWTPVYDQPVYDDDVFEGMPGLKSKSVPLTSSNLRFDENVFASSSPKQNRRINDHFDDLLGNLGRSEKAPETKTSARSSSSRSHGFDDLLGGFGSSSPASVSRTAPESHKPPNRTSVVDDPFVVLESNPTPTSSSSAVSTGGLEEIGNPASGGHFGDLDPLNGMGKSIPPFAPEKRGREKVRSPSKMGPSDNGTRTYSNREHNEGSFRYSEGPSQIPVDDFQGAPLFDMPNDSTDSKKSFSENASSPPYPHVSTKKNFQSDVSPNSDRPKSDDIWLSVSEVPLYTEPTKAPPPSRPPPPVPRKTSKTGSNFSSANARRNGDGYFPSYSSYPGSTKPGHPVGANLPGSQIDEFEDFVTGKTQNSVHDNTYVHPSEEMDAAAAAMEEAMNRAQAKFRHAKEVREREYAKAARSKENVQTDRDEHVNAYEREFRESEVRVEHERQLREKEEEEREQRRLERERERARQAEIERLKARQAVERATREARERAAADARSRAERASVEKVQAEARERAERAAVQRAHAEARERAAAEARDRVEKAAAEARERANEEARIKEANEKAEARRRAERAAVEKAAAEARERAAAEARERAAAASRNQQKNENDLESFFSSRARAAPKARASSPDSVFDSQFQNKEGSDPPKGTSSTSVPPSNMRKASSTTNIVDDLSSIFGAPSSSGEFQEVEGESEERRRARLERHQRTQERAAKALAEKNQRDLQAQREQEERNRIGDSLDFEIKRWAAGKEGNLRALLSTLQYVLWPECGWQPVSLTDLITGASVKKCYRKATLCIHPDKVQQKGANLQQKYIAEKVFDLLKEAWNKFNSEELF